MISRWFTSENLKNYMIDDPILDWLNIYGHKFNFIPECKNSDDLFNQFMLKQNLDFKKRIINDIKINYPSDYKIIPSNQRLRKKIALTIDSISIGIPIILNSKIFSKKYNLIGSPDILIRSDYLQYFMDSNFICGLNFEELNNLDNLNKYYIIDIKNSKFNLTTNNNSIQNLSKSIYLQKTKTIINNICLSDMQNKKNRHCFLIGKHINDNDNNNNNYIIKLNGIIDVLDKDRHIVTKILNSLEWQKELITEGNQWNIYNPSRTELYPNMSNTDDHPWRSTKIIIAKKISEITLIWNCGLKERNIAHNKGIYQWNNCNSNDLNIESNKKAKIINNMIDINKYDNQVIIHPRKIKNRENISNMKKYNIEFYVDFETTVNYSEDDIYLNNNSFIFMIGCLTVYKVNNKEYNSEFKNFISDDLSSEQENLIINQWISYMNNIQRCYSNDNYQPHIYHWSSAELVIYNNCIKKYENLKPLNFIDLLDVFKNEPITIKDAFSYSLKTISKCFYKHGLIKTIWDSDIIIDGKNAMFQAWKYYNGNKTQKYILKDIEKYNYIDCKVMEEILTYLRKMI